VDGAAAASLRQASQPWIHAMKQKSGSAAATA
jgi:hypothetical protein